MRVNVMVNTKVYVNGTPENKGRLYGESEYSVGSFDDVESAQDFYETFIYGYDNAFNGISTFEPDYATFEHFENCTTTVVTIYMRLGRNPAYRD